MKNIWSGDYLRYDGKLIQVVGMLENAETGETLVVCRQSTLKAQQYYAVGRESFIGTAQVGGKTVPKYRRCSKRRSVSEAEACAVYESSGEYPPEQAIRAKRSNRSEANEYAAYAKELCETHLRDLRLVREGGNAPIGEIERAKKNVLFLQRCFENELKEYAQYFRERFVRGSSIRKYAAAHGINRGSAAYTQKKFFAALARCLQENDI